MVSDVAQSLGTRSGGTAGYFISTTSSMCSHSRTRNMAMDKIPIYAAQFCTSCIVNLLLMPDEGVFQTLLNCKITGYLSGRIRYPSTPLLGTFFGLPRWPYRIFSLSA